MHQACILRSMLMQVCIVPKPAMERTEYCWPHIAGAQLTARRRAAAAAEAAHPGASQPAGCNLCSWRQCRSCCALTFHHHCEQSCTAEAPSGGCAGQQRQHRRAWTQPSQSKALHPHI